MLTLLSIGLVVGFVSSFFGIGGGAIIVPGLYLIYPQIPSQTVIASSLGVIFFNSLINTGHFWRLKQRPHLRIVAPLAVAMGVGASLGSCWALLLSPFLLKKIFAVLLFLVSLHLSFSRPTIPPPSPQRPPYQTLKGLLIGLTAGLIAGLTGLGGGVIIVPTLLLLYRLPFSQIACYSNPAMGACALAGVLTLAFFSPSPPLTPLSAFLRPYQWGQFNLMIVFLLVAGAWPSSLLGARWTAKIQQKRAQKVFALLFYALSLIIFFS